MHKNNEEIMKSGQITCPCGNVYFVESIYDSVICMACKRMNPFDGVPVVQEEAVPQDIQLEKEAQV
jgi:hypothetical protein